MPALPSAPVIGALLVEVNVGYGEPAPYAGGHLQEVNAGHSPAAAVTGPRRIQSISYSKIAIIPSRPFFPVSRT